MKLKLKYEKQDEIPTGFEELYEEKDSSWLLVGIEGMKTQKDVDAVKGALDKERKARSEAEGKLKKFEKLSDKDPDDLLKAMEEVEDLRAQLEEAGKGSGKSGGGKSDEEVDRAVRLKTSQLQRDLEKAQNALTAKQKELEAVQAQAGELSGRIKRSTVEGELSKAAAALKTRSEALPDVLLHRDVFELDEDGKTVRTRENVGVTPGLSPADWLADMKSTRPHWWPESVGGGANGGDGKRAGGDNPFAKGNANVSKAMALAKADPAKALTLAKQAGYTSVEAAAVAMARPPKQGAA